MVNTGDYLRKQEFESNLSDALSYQNISDPEVAKMQSILNGSHHKLYGGKRINSYKDRFDKIESLGFDFTNIESVKSLHNAIKSTTYQKQNLRSAEKDKKVMRHLREKISFARSVKRLEAIANSDSVISNLPAETAEVPSEILYLNSPSKSPPSYNPHPESGEVVYLREPMMRSYLARLDEEDSATSAKNSGDSAESSNSKTRKKHKKGNFLLKAAAILTAGSFVLDTAYAAITSSQSLFNKTKQVVVGAFNEVQDNGHFNASNYGAPEPVKVAVNFLRFFEDKTPFEDRQPFAVSTNGLVEVCNRDDEGSLTVPVNPAIAQIDENYAELMAKGKSRAAEFEADAARIWAEANPDSILNPSQILDSSLASVVNSDGDKIN